MKRSTPTFRGMAPRLEAPYLPENASQEAINTRLLTGDLEAFYRPGFVHELPGPAVCVAPSFSIAADPTDGDVPFEVAFTLTELAGTSPFTFAWDFGDGGTSTEQNPTHEYTAATTGAYAATVTITNECGEQILSVEIQAADPPPPSTCAPTGWDVVDQDVLFDGGGGGYTANGVAYGTGVFVIAGQGLKLVYSDDDGLTWNACTLGVSQQLFDIHFAAGLFVACGQGGACHVSADGITFTRLTAQFNAFTENQAVTYGAGTWLIAATGNGYMYTSPDGMTWTQNTNVKPFGNFTVPNKMTFGAGLFVAVGSSSIATSPDGLAWTTRLAIDVDVKGVAYNDDLSTFIATCEDNRRYHSPDGIDWTAIPGNPRVAVLDTIWSVEYACGAWVCGWGDGFIDQSTDEGDSWPVDFGPLLPPPDDVPIFDIAHNPTTDTWIATGTRGNVYRGTQ